MSGDRGHHPVSPPEIKPWHQGSKITQRWTSKSPRPAQARPPPGTAPQPLPATAAEGAPTRPKARRAN